MPLSTIMIKTIFLAIFLISVNLGFSQSEKQTDKNISAVFVRNFNSSDYERIFNLFSSEMKNALPKDKNTKFLSDLKQQAGNIKSREFRRYVRGSFASYRAKFEKGLFTINISTNHDSEINGLYIEPFEDLPVLKRNSTKLILPFKGEWTVFWGGDTEELNYHVENRAQKNAFDLIVTDKNGKSYRTDGQTNEDYYAFGKEIFAPCDGEVVMVVDGVDDNIPGNLNPIYIPGNTVVLKTDNNEYLFLAHFKQNSIKVKLGQKVNKRDVLGLCGNSGNSSEPHLHFHIQNVKNMIDATGIKCYFDEILIDGKTKNDYSPIKGEKIQNVK